MNVQPLYSLQLTGIRSLDFWRDGCQGLPEKAAATVSGARCGTTAKFWNGETPTLIGFQPILEQESNHVHRIVLHGNMESICEDEGYEGLVLHGRQGTPVAGVRRIQPKHTKKCKFAAYALQCCIMGKSLPDCTGEWRCSTHSGIEPSLFSRH